MIYVLNALVPPSDGFGLMLVVPSTLKMVKEAIARGAQCYIGHPATARLLGVSPNRGEAKPKIGDTAYVVRLRFRTAQPGQEIEVREEDLEILRVDYLGLEILNKQVK
ncbi:MAG: hypothetical protein QXT84_01015 [Candidatus Bathyarchaeia archaeon]